MITQASLKVTSFVKRNLEVKQNTGKMGVDLLYQVCNLDCIASGMMLRHLHSGEQVCVNMNHNVHKKS